MWTYTARRRHTSPPSIQLCPTEAESKNRYILPRFIFASLISDRFPAPHRVVHIPGRQRSAQLEHIYTRIQAVRHRPIVSKTTHSNLHTRWISKESHTRYARMENKSVSPPPTDSFVLFFSLDVDIFLARSFAELPSQIAAIGSAESFASIYKQPCIFLVFSF